MVFWSWVAVASNVFLRWTSVSRGSACYSWQLAANFGALGRSRPFARRENSPLAVNLVQKVPARRFVAARAGRERFEGSRSRTRFTSSRRRMRPKTAAGRPREDPVGRQLLRRRDAGQKATGSGVRICLTSDLGFDRCKGEPAGRTLLRRSLVGHFAPT